MICAAAVALAACSNSKNCDKNCDSKCDKADDDVTLTYKGVLPAADAAGIEYLLTLEYDSEGNDGDYVLTQTVVGDESNQTVTNGDFKVYTSTNNSVDQKYIKLTPEHNDRASEVKGASNEVYYFLIDNDSTITLTTADLQPAASGLNYSLTVVK